MNPKTATQAQVMMMPKTLKMLTLKSLMTAQKNQMTRKSSMMIQQIMKTLKTPTLKRPKMTRAMMTQTTKKKQK